MNARCCSCHCHCWRKFTFRAGHTAPPMTRALRISLALFPVAFELAPQPRSQGHTRFPACGPEAASSLQNLTHMPILSQLAGEQPHLSETSPLSLPLHMNQSLVPQCLHCCLRRRSPWALYYPHWCTYPALPTRP